MFMKKIILASASPRRKEILKNAGLKFKVVESNLREYVDPKLKPHELVQKLSLEKAKAVYKTHKDSIVIGVDTIVVCREKVLGKPKDEKDARAMLKFLSNKAHFVITGFAIISDYLKRPILKSEETKVFFRKINQLEIDSYAKTKEPFDKAGGYAIQGKASKFIEKIDGDLQNAVGLPIKSLIKELKNLGVK